MVKYYPQIPSIATIAKQYPQLGIVNKPETQRFQDIEDRKKRGKGAPKKAKTAGTYLKIYVSRSQTYSA